jgi:plasmid stabilization system protein ParE
MSEYGVLWTDAARRDLDAIVEYIAEDSVENALSVLDRLETCAGALGTSPARGRKVPELAALDVHHYRELIERPWRILDRIEGDRVIVVAVLDGRRDLTSLLIERLVRS